MVVRDRSRYWKYTYNILGQLVSTYRFNKFLLDCCISIARSLSKSGDYDTSFRF